MVKTLPPAGSTSPTLATRYWMRPSRGAIKRVVGDVDAEELDLVLGRSEGVLSLQDAGRGGMQRGGGAVELLPSLIEQFLRRIASLKEVAGTVELLLRQLDLCLLLLLQRARFVDRALRLLLLRLGLFERRFEVLGIHAGHDLAGMHHVALVNQAFGQASGELGVDIDLVGLDPAVARDDAGGQRLLRLLPPVIRTAARGESDRNDGKRDPGPPSPPGHWSGDGQGRDGRLVQLGGRLGHDLGTTGRGIPRCLALPFGFLDQMSSPRDADEPQGLMPNSSDIVVDLHQIELRRKRAKGRLTSQRAGLVQRQRLVAWRPALYRRRARGRARDLYAPPPAPAATSTKNIRHPAKAA